MSLRVATPGAPQGSSAGPAPIGRLPTKRGGPLSGRVGFFAAGVVIVAIAIVATLAMVVLRPLSPSPSPSPSTSPSPSPTPASSEIGALDVLHAFRDRTLGRDLNYRMTATGTSTTPAGKVSWTGTWEIAGRDYHVKLKTAGKPTVDAYVIGNRVWSKNSKGKYVVATSKLSEWRWAPFLDIGELKEVDYLGPVIRDGTTYYVLRSNAWYMPDNGKLLNRSGVGAATERSLEVLVTEDGTPHYATFTLTIDDAGRTATGKTEFTITAVGEPNTLKVPK